MSELRRLLENCDDPLAVELLHSAREESPSPRSLPRTAAALGIGAAIAGSSLSFAKTAHALSSVSGGLSQHGVAAIPLASKAAVVGTGAFPSIIALSKSLAVGLFSGVLVIGGARYATEGAKPVAQQRAAGAKAAPAAAAARSTRSQASSGLTQREPSALNAPPSATPDLVSASADAPPQLTAARAGEASRRSGVPSGRVEGSRLTGAPNGSSVGSHGAFAVEDAAGDVPGPQMDARSDPSLKLEVERLDNARRSLLVNDPSAALREVALYGAARPSGVLEPEALVIRIQALEKLGQRTEAEALARDFVQRFPKHRHAQALSLLFHREPR